VIGRLAGTLAINPNSRPAIARRYVVVRDIEALAKQDSFKSTQAHDDPGPVRPAQGRPDNPERQFGVQLELYQKYLGRRRLWPTQRREVGLLPQPIPAWGKTLTEDENAHRRGPGLRRALSPQWSPA